MKSIIRDIWFFAKYFLYKPYVVLFYFMIGCDGSNLTVFRRKRLRYFLENALKNSEYYRTLNISDKNHVDLANFPILSRKELVQNMAKILITKPYKLRSGSTGGSTGEPLTYYYSSTLPIEAFRWAYYRKMKVRPSDNSLHMWRMPKVDPLRKFVEETLLWPTKRYKFDVSVVSNEVLSQAINCLQNSNIPLVQGYVGAIEELSRFMVDRGFENESVKAVWVTSAPLGEASLKIIQKAFKTAVVYDEYGSSEIPYIGLRKASDGEDLLINSGYRVVEVVNIDDHGYGDVVITDLLNRSMPLIRYCNGDRARIINSERNYSQLLSPIKGRESEKIYITKDSFLESSYMTTIFDDFAEEISQFQVVQNNIGEVQIDLVWSKEVNITRQSDILRSVKNTLDIKSGKCLTITFISKEFIRSDRGKTKYIISNVN